MQIDDDEDGGLGMPAGKRVGPEEVEPVQIGRTRYEVIHWGRERGLGQNGGYVAAIDADSGKELWTLKVYAVAYDPAMEEDVQDIFIKSMSVNGSGTELTVIDERNRRFVVNLKSRTARAQ
jgi:hypothetical protein